MKLEKLGNIAGISKKIGYIYTRPLPGIGIWKEYSPDKIEKIVKKRKFEKPNPSYTQ